jgi:hypothetical protein
MRVISITNLLAVPVILFGILSVVRADAFEEKLEKEYPLTVVNAEGEVVTQGAVLVLKKSGLIAGATKACTNDYANGQLKLGGSLLSRAACLKVGGEGVGGATRPFVKGEKLSISKIEMIKDAIAFSLISDPVSDVRYKAEIRFPVAKGAAPDLAQADQMILQVFSIAPPAPPADQAQAPAAPQGAPAAAEQPLPPVAPPPPPPDPAATTPIAPPPPPPDQPAAPPQTLSLGLTTDQVIAILGQPSAVADLGAKKIYTYKSPNMKVIFVNGKVTDMQ